MFIDNYIYFLRYFHIHCTVRFFFVTATILNKQIICKYWKRSFFYQCGWSCSSPPSWRLRSGWRWGCCRWRFGGLFFFRGTMFSLEVRMWSAGFLFKESCKGILHIQSWGKWRKDKDKNFKNTPQKAAALLQTCHLLAKVIICNEKCCLYDFSEGYRLLLFEGVTVYRSYSNVSLEKVTFKNNLFDKFQSGFRQRQSTSLLGVTNDILFQADHGDSCILVSLDWSAAFDIADGKTLLEEVGGDKWLFITWYILCIHRW